jgi:lipopolysaccharide/colanic/teichoic acid biosynthesis glycosyltransferase
MPHPTDLAQPNRQPSWWLAIPEVCPPAVGSFLRHTSGNELPQLINVLWGQMSLVGPRPCLDWETESSGATF